MVSRTNRKKLKDSNIRELIIAGIEVTELSQWHFRLEGETTVDYWPSRNKYWETGTHNRARHIELQDLIFMLKPKELDDEAARHMKAISGR